MFDVFIDQDMTHLIMMEILTIPTWKKTAVIVHLTIIIPRLVSCFVLSQTAKKLENPNTLLFWAEMFNNINSIKDREKDVIRSLPQEYCSLATPNPALAQVWLLLMFHCFVLIDTDVRMYLSRQWIGDASGRRIRNPWY